METIKVEISDKSGRRGEQGLPNRRDITRREPSVDLEVGSGYVAAIVGGNWNNGRMSTLRIPVG